LGTNNRAGMGMGEFFYPQAGVGKILSGGYGCGWAIPNGFVPIAISTPHLPGPLRTAHYYGFRPNESAGRPVTSPPHPPTPRRVPGPARPAVHLAPRMPPPAPPRAPRVLLARRHHEPTRGPTCVRSHVSVPLPEDKATEARETASVCRSRTRTLPTLPVSRQLTAVE
jgi:hypothetical protein